LALQNIATWFEASGVPCTVSENVMGELWAKFIVNCAVNAISALTQAPYGRMLEQPDIKTLISALVRETVSVAHAQGVQLKEIDHEGAVFQVMKAMSGQYSSTAQDLARGKPTEIDALNGYVSRIAKLHRLEAPLNAWLTAMVKLRAGQI
jgi:2-dehydropantoate 2-reductase